MPASWTQHQEFQSGPADICPRKTVAAQFCNNLILAEPVPSAAQSRKSGVKFNYMKTHEALLVSAAMLLLPLLANAALHDLFQQLPCIVRINQ